jgi:hypothetical protein
MKIFSRSTQGDICRVTNSLTADFICKERTTGPVTFVERQGTNIEYVIHSFLLAYDVINKYAVAKRRYDLNSQWANVGISLTNL